MQSSTIFFIINSKIIWDVEEMTLLTCFLKQAKCAHWWRNTHVTAIYQQGLTSQVQSPWGPNKCSGFMCNLEDHKLLLITESTFQIAQFIITGPKPWLCRICLMLCQKFHFELPSLFFHYLRKLTLHFGWIRKRPLNLQSLFPTLVY